MGWDGFYSLPRTGLPDYIQGRGIFIRSTGRRGGRSTLVLALRTHCRPADRSPSTVPSLPRAPAKIGTNPLFLTKSPVKRSGWPPPQPFNARPARRSPTNWSLGSRAPHRSPPVHRHGRPALRPPRDVDQLVAPWTVPSLKRPRRLTLGGRNVEPTGRLPRSQGEIWPSAGRTRRPTGCISDPPAGRLPPPSKSVGPLPWPTGRPP